MFKLTDEALEQLKKVTRRNLALTVAENIVFLLLRRWNIQALAGSLLGFAVCFVYFYMICASVPKALRYGDEDMAKKSIAVGRNARMMVIVLGVVIALKVEAFGTVAALIPILFFNRLSITLLNLKGE